MWLEALAAIAPGLVKLGLELWTGKKLSWEQFHEFIAEDKKNLSKIADSTVAFRENIKKLKKKRLEYLKKLKEDSQT